MRHFPSFLTTPAPESPSLLAVLLLKLFPKTIAGLCDAAYDRGFDDCEMEAEQAFSDGFAIANGMKKRRFTTTLQGLEAELLNGFPGREG